MTDRLTSDDAQLIASVKLGEGLRLNAYPDPLTGAAPWTIGYGHTGANIGPRMTCTADQAEEWLEDDLCNAIAGLDLQEPWWREIPLDGQRVVAELVFNMGLAHLKGFHRFLADLQAAKYGPAADELLDSLWARQVGDRALRLTRRLRACSTPTNFGADLTTTALEG